MLHSTPIMTKSYISLEDGFYISLEDGSDKTILSIIKYSFYGTNIKICKNIL